MVHAPSLLSLLMYTMQHVEVQVTSAFEGALSATIPQTPIMALVSPRASVVSRDSWRTRFPLLLEPLGRAP